MFELLSDATCVCVPNAVGMRRERTRDDDKEDERVSFRNIDLPNARRFIPFPHSLFTPY